MTKRSGSMRQLYEAVLCLRTVGEAEAFFKDLLTETELRELSKRWTAARMLEAGEPYTAIIEATGLSSTTVARVSRWLKKGAGGYRMIMRRTERDGRRAS